MGKTFTLTTALYVIALLGCTFAFYVQRHVVLDDHIKPGNATAGDPIDVEIIDEGVSAVRKAKVKLLQESPITNPLRMGGEMQEQLQAVLFANLATGVYLIVMNSRRFSRDNALTEQVSK